MESIANVFSYMYHYFYRMLDLCKQKPNNNNKIKCQFLKVFFTMHDFMDMPKCFSIQLMIMHK